MKPDFKKNSNLIKLSESTRKKAIRKVIGSIFLLLLALVMLLNVTTRMKPVLVNPSVIEIKNNSSQVLASGVIQKTLSSNPIASTVAAIAKVNSSQQATSNVTAKSATPSSEVDEIGAIANADNTHKSNSSNPQSSGFKARVAQKSNDSIAETSEVVATKFTLTNEVNTKKPTPEDILNGNETPNSKLYYVQIITSNNNKNLENVRSKLKQNNLKIVVSAKINPKSVRLKVGPFDSKDHANTELKKLKAELLHE